MEKLKTKFRFHLTMTIKKAIEMVENLRDCEFESMQLFNENNSLDRKMWMVCKAKGNYLNKILDEIKPNCKHPKKMRDRTKNGQEYCMSCNLDL